MTTFETIALIFTIFFGLATVLSLLYAIWSYQQNTKVTQEQEKFGQKQKTFDKRLESLHENDQIINQNLKLSHNKIYKKLSFTHENLAEGTQNTITNQKTPTRE